MSILIFKTVNEERTKMLLKSAGALHADIYFILPESEISIYDQLWKNIHYIGTSKKYIDCDTLMLENKIPDIKYQEIWIPSPKIDSMYTYHEVYTVVSMLKYCKVYYKVVNENNIETYDLKKDPLFSRTHGLLVDAVKAYIVLLYWIEKKFKGYR